MLSSLGLLVAGLRWWPDMPMAFSASLLPLGLGLGLPFPVVTVVAQRVSPTQHRGIATAAPVMLGSLDGAAGVALPMAVLARPMVTAFVVSTTVGAAMATGLHAVFGCAAGGVPIAAAEFVIAARKPGAHACDRIAHPTGLLNSRPQCRTLLSGGGCTSHTLTDGSALRPRSSARLPPDA